MAEEKRREAAGDQVTDRRHFDNSVTKRRNDGNDPFMGILSDVQYEGESVPGYQNIEDSGTGSESIH